MMGMIVVDNTRYCGIQLDRIRNTHMIYSEIYMFININCLQNINLFTEKVKIGIDFFKPCV
jgi:hypothetical protein